MFIYHRTELHVHKKKRENWKIYYCTVKMLHFDIVFNQNNIFKSG